MIAVFILTGMRRISSLALPFFIIPLIGLLEYGKIVEIITWASLLTSILVFGQNTSLLTLPSVQVISEHIAAYLWLLFGLSFIFIIVFQYYALHDITYKLLLGVVMSAYMLYQSKLRYSNNTIRSLLGGAILQPVLLVFGLLLTKSNVNIASLILIISWVLPTLLLLDSKSIFSYLTPKLNLDINFTKHSMMIFVASLFDFLLLRIDLLFITLVLSNKELAIYALAANLALLILQPQAILSFLVEPKIAKIKSDVLASKELKKLKIINKLMTFSGVIFFIFFGENVIDLVLKTEEEQYAQDIFKITLVLMVFYLIASFVGGLYPSILNLIYPGKNYSVLSSCFSVSVYILLLFLIYLYLEIDLQLLAIATGTAQLTRFLSASYLVKMHKH